MLDPSHLNSLTSIVGHSNLRKQEELVLLDPGADARNLGADVLVAPGSTPELSEVVRYCNQHRIAIVPQGGRTGLAQGAVSCAGEIILSLSRFNEIHEINSQDRIAIVGSGVTLEALAVAASAVGLEPGIDLAARGTATIGGMISTNAGGIEAFRNGLMRHRVLGLEAILPDGTIVSDLSRVEKCNEGYDVKQLLIGAEGTLGVITKAILRLEPITPGRATALVAFESTGKAVRLFHQLQPLGLLTMDAMWQRYIEAAAREMGRTKLIEFSKGSLFVIVELREAAQLEAILSDAYSEGLINGAIVAKSESERREIWILREDSWAIDRLYPGGLWYDVSVPLAYIDQYLSRLDASLALVDTDPKAYVIGHLGDGNLHITVAGSQPLEPLKDAISKAVYDGIKEVGGSISAEHGIGLEKRESLQRYGDPGKLIMMKTIKRAVDPNNIMNPGKVIG